MTLKELTKAASAELQAAGIESHETEAGYFVADAAGMSDTDLILEGKQTASEDVAAKVRDFVRRRCTNEPWQYIVGHAAFRDLDLQVGPGCLIPRPETEYMLDYVLKDLPRGGRVCELGIGSGAISLAIATERLDSEVTGIEISPAALRLARINLEAISPGNVTFLEGDLFAPLADGTKFDLIVANLPYIPEGERAALPQNVRDFEPAIALFGGDDGLSVIGRAIQDAPSYLKAGGRIIFELDPQHAEKAAKLMASTGAYAEIRILEDQYGARRFLTGRGGIRLSR